MVCMYMYSLWCVCIRSLCHSELIITGASLHSRFFDGDVEGESLRGFEDQLLPVCAGSADENHGGVLDLRHVLKQPLIRHDPSLAAVNPVSGEEHLQYDLLSAG